MAQDAAALSKTQCQGAIWDALGFEDALDGDSVKKFADHKKDCAKAGIAVNEASYERGRSTALEIYCSPTYGLAVGMNGDAYEGVCVGEREGAFLKAYQMGSAFYPAAKAAWELRSQLDAAQSIRNSAVSTLNSAQSTLSKSDATADEKTKALNRGKKAQKDIRDANFQIAFLEGQLNAAERSFANAQYDLDRAIETEDLFPEGNPAQRGYFTMAFDAETVGEAVVKDVKDGGAAWFVEFTSPPLAAPLSRGAFTVDAVTPQQMLERRGLERNKECRLNSKLVRETKTFARTLQKQTVTASLKSVIFTPAARTSSYNLAITPPAAEGALTFADGKTAGQKLIEQGLAAPDGGEALPRWYKSPDCQP